jgi:hypothetical protein
MCIVTCGGFSIVGNGTAGMRIDVLSLVTNSLPCPKSTTEPPINQVTHADPLLISGNYEDPDHKKPNVGHSESPPKRNLRIGGVGALDMSAR